MSCSQGSFLQSCNVFKCSLIQVANTLFTKCCSSSRIFEITLHLNDWARRMTLLQIILPNRILFFKTSIFLKRGGVTIKRVSHKQATLSYFYVVYTFNRALLLIDVKKWGDPGHPFTVLYVPIIRHK